MGVSHTFTNFLSQEGQEGQEGQDFFKKMLKKAEKASKKRNEFGAVESELNDPATKTRRICRLGAKTASLVPGGSHGGD